jgi:hypothetical protein
MRRIAEFFDALTKLDEPNKGLLLQEVSRHLREHLPDAPTIPVVTPNASLPQTFSDRCRELAAVAPNDRAQHVLLKFAHVYEIEAAVRAANVIVPASDVA